MSKVLCIYHANCADGLGAAWAVHRALGDDVEFIAVKYGEDLPYCVRIENKLSYRNLADRDILFVDFSAPLEVLRAVAREARSVLVLDHHKTAQEDLSELLQPPTGGWSNWQPFPVQLNAAPPNLAAVFDMNFSGAGLTWDYLRPGQSRPRIIDLIEDRDLWKFAFGDESRAFHAVLSSYDWSDLPKMFIRLDEWCSWGGISASLLDEGHAILRANRQAVAAAVAASRRTMRIAGHVVPCVNVPPSMASDAGHLLYEPIGGPSILGYPDSVIVDDGAAQENWCYFSATYYDAADGKRHFSLRSPEGGADVGRIAKAMAEHFKAMDQHYASMGSGWIMTNWAGGGHVHAAGFDAPLGWEGE